MTSETPGSASDEQPTDISSATRDSWSRPIPDSSTPESGESGPFHDEPAGAAPDPRSGHTTQQLPLSAEAATTASDTWIQPVQPEPLSPPGGFAQPSQPAPVGQPAPFGEPAPFGQPGPSGQPGPFGQPGQPGPFGQPGQPGPFGQQAPAYPGGQSSAGQSPSGQVPPGPYPPGAYPPGRYPQGSYPQGSYPQGSYPPGQFGYHPQFFAPTNVRNNPFAITALVLGIAQAVLLLTVVGNIVLAIPAIVFASIALKQIRLRGERGRGMAIAGLVLGILGVVIFVLIIILIVIGLSVQHGSGSG